MGDLSDNLRHWNTLRIAELAIFLASTGGLLTVYFKGDPPPAPAGIIIKVAGLVITVMFWILQERIMMWFFNFLRRARELEAELGFEQYLSSPQGRVITGRNAIRMFFVIMIFFWASLLIRFPQWRSLASLALVRGESCHPRQSWVNPTDRLVRGI